MSLDKKYKKWGYALLLMLLWCGLASFITSRYYAARVQHVVAEQRATTDVVANDLADSIRRNVSYLSGIPNMLSHLVRVNKAVAKFATGSTPSSLSYELRKKKWTQDAELHDLSLYLAVVQNSLNVDNVFLVNAAGDGIASSLWDQPGTPIGTNYASRDWFKSGLEGQPGMQYAMGRTTYIPGLYFSTPVLQDGKFMGAVVVKIDVPKLSYLTTQVDAYLADQNGVIILAHDKTLELQALPDATVHQLSEQRRLELYQRSHFATLAIQSAGNKFSPELSLLAGSHSPHLRVSRTLSEYGYTVYVESDLVQLAALDRERWLFFLLLTLLGAVFIFTATGLIGYLHATRLSRARLLKSETRYRTLVEWMPVAVIVHRAGKLRYVNQAAVQLFGAEQREQLLGSELLTHIHPVYVERVRAHLQQRALDGKPTRPLELRSIKMDGTVIDIEAQDIGIEFDGAPASFVLVTDISERKRNGMLVQGQTQILEMIATSTATPVVLEAVVRFIEAQSDELLCAICVIDETGTRLQKGVAPSLSDAYLRALEGIAVAPGVGSCGTAAYRKEPVYVADIATDPLWSDYKILALPEGLRACWSTPILDDQQRVLAIFSMYLRRTGLPQTEHLQLIETAVHIAAIAISRERAEVALRKREVAFRTLFEASRDALMTSSPERGFIDGNQAALELFGCPDKANFIALSPADLSPRLQPDGMLSTVKAQQMMHTALAQGSHYFEWLHQRLDGREFYADVLLTRIEIEGKAMLHATVRDISERKRVAQLEQQRLDELETLYRFSKTLGNALLAEDICEIAMDYLQDLLQADRVAILLNDTASAMRFKASRSLSATYQQQAEGISPWSTQDADPQPVYIEQVESGVQHARERANLLQEGIRSLCCLPLVQHGQLLGKLAVYFNQPHEYTQHEMQLASSVASHVAFALDRNHAEQQFADLFEFAPDAIVITNLLAVITKVNRQAENLFGYSKHELIGQTIDVLIPKDRRDERRDMRQRFLNSAMRPRPLGGMSRKDLRGISKTGHIFPVEISLSPMHSQNGMVIAAAIRDISARQQVMDQLMLTAQDLEQANALVEQERAQLASRVEERTSQLRIANRAKDSFLATMSHEIRTPLGGLLGMMELLSLTALDGEQSETLQAARNSGKGLLRIVDDILDWSKIEAGKLMLAPRAAPILPMLKGVVATYSQLASAKGIQLSYQYDETLSQAHLFDQLRLSQILNNFTSNAIKFTANGKVQISASLAAQQAGFEEVCFCVSDTGVGIESVHLERLFQQYEQASADTARMYGGTGLGLAICRSLAELMEGRISVTSTLGQGSAFSITVRLAVADQSAQRDLLLHQARGAEGELPNPAQRIMPHNVAEKVSILVVDDHPVNRMLLKQQLEQLGLQADVAAYAIVALALWQTGDYDLIITDCHMPEMDGYELTRCIRDIEIQDARARTPIIAWTANVMAEEAGHCLAAGMDDMLTKPTELANLRTTLVKWLQRKELAVVQDETEACSSPLATQQMPLASNEQGNALELSTLQKIAQTPAQQVEMLQEFYLHHRNDVASLVAALQEGNPAAVTRGAHRIKGACRMVGALPLANLCASIEQAASYGDINSARTIAKALYVANRALEYDVAHFIEYRASTNMDRSE